MYIIIVVVTMFFCCEQTINPLYILLFFAVIIQMLGVLGEPSGQVQDTATVKSTVMEDGTICLILIISDMFVAYRGISVTREQSQESSHRRGVGVLVGGGMEF